MSKAAKKSLKSNFIYNFISQILTLIVPLITTPYVSRVLHETGNGQYSYSISIVTFFILISNLGFEIYGQRQIAACRDNQEEKNKIFWELFVLRTIFSAFSLIILCSIIFTIGFGERYNILIFILSLEVVAIPFDIQYFFRGEENFKSIAIRTIIMRVVELIFIFLFVKTEKDTWIYALCISGSVLFSNVIMWTSLKGKIKFIKISQLKLLRHLKPSILIFLPTLATTLYSVFDKTMIGLLAENADYENGCYEQAYKINSICLLPVTIISSVMTSRNAYDFNNGDVESLKVHIDMAIKYVWMMGTPLIFGFAVLSNNLSFWFLGDGYLEVPILMQIMSVRFLVSGFSEVLGNQLFIAIRKEIYPTIAASVAAIINIVLNFFLIKHCGALGASIATAVCEFAVMAILIIIAIAKKYITVKNLFSGAWRYILAGGIMFVVIFFMQRYMNYSVWSFILITATGAAVYAITLFALRDQFFINAVKWGFQTIKNKFKKPVKQKETDDTPTEN